MPSDSGLQVFLCHAKEDKVKVRELHKWLKAKGHRPWLDEVSIAPGKNWLLEIQQAIRESHVILVCLSSHSVRKHGVVQREIKLALEAASERPEDEIFIIPCKLEECDIPIGLRHWQWVDLFKREGRKNLEASLSLCLGVLSPIDDTGIKEVGEQPREDAGGEGVGEAFEFVMNCAGTAARNTVNKILQGYEIRKDRLSHGQLVEWLGNSVIESQNTLSSVSMPEGNDFIATRLKGAAMGATFAAVSFERVIRQVADFVALESRDEEREEYILVRLQAILDEWESYDIDEWAARNDGSN
jgi:TIR domain